MAVVGPAVEFHAVVHHFDLLGRDAVTADDDVAGIVAHRDDPGRRVHPAPFNVVDVLIDMLAAAVEFRRMHVNHQGFAGPGDQRNAGRKRHPVVGMDEVVFFGLGQLEHALGVALDLGQQIRSVVRGPQSHVLAQIGELRSAAAGRVWAAGGIGCQDGVHTAHTNVVKGQTPGVF